jgi:hypothetical protein
MRSTRARLLGQVGHRLARRVLGPLGPFAQRPAIIVVDPRIESQAVSDLSEQLALVNARITGLGPVTPGEIEAPELTAQALVDSFSLNCSVWPWSISSISCPASTPASRPRLMAQGAKDATSQAVSDLSEQLALVNARITGLGPVTLSGEGALVDSFSLNCSVWPWSISSISCPASTPASRSRGNGAVAFRGTRCWALHWRSF